MHSFYSCHITEELQTTEYKYNDTKDADTTYCNSKPVNKDAIQATAPLVLLPNRRINAKRRRGFSYANMNSILFFVILYLLIDVPSTYQQRKYRLLSSCLNIN